MENKTRFLPGFHWPTLRRKPRSAARQLAEMRSRIRDHSLIRLQDGFGRYIAESSLLQSEKGGFSRRRLLSRSNTFWAFFAQILSADRGCKEVVRKLQALAASKGMAPISSSSSAYCQARSKLETASLEAILAATCGQVRDRSQSSSWKQRRVVVVDGTGVSMPDTPDNQSIWPQPANQSVGCGFPQARLCAYFDLKTGGLLSCRLGHRKQHELPLLRQQWDHFERGDILLGDKGFCSYYDVWQQQCRGIDTVHTLARRTPVSAGNALQVLAPNDLLIQWPKPKWNRALSYDYAQWQALPDQLTLRQIQVTVDHPGFRTRGFHLITTLLDPQQYPAADLAQLYYARWSAELNFRDIKTTLGMDVLHCQSPEMVTKEILMHWIVYNVLRLTIHDAAQQQGVDPRTISFKASLQAVRHWEPQLSRTGLTTAQTRLLMDQLREAIAASVLHPRLGRTEPRCVKRRSKPYALLTEHRRTFREIPHRGRYRAKTA